MIRNFQRLARSPVTWSLVLVLVAAHVVVLMIGWDLSAPLTYSDLPPWWRWAMSGHGMAKGQVWQLFTYAFLHGSWWHLGVNALFLLAVGSRIEHMTGGRILFWTSVAGVFAGGLAHLLLGHGMLVGFSGGAMALWMLLIGLSPQSRILPFPGPCLWLGWGVLLLSLALALCSPDGPVPVLHPAGEWLENHFGSVLFGIGHACHLGGGLAGWLVGAWILRPRVTLQSLQAQRARREERARREQMRD